MEEELIVAEVESIVEDIGDRKDLLTGKKVYEGLQEIKKEILLI